MTVTTYEELAAAVRKDEPVLRLESGAKYFYESLTGTTVGGGLLGALPGLLVAGPLGAIVGGAVGAAIGSSGGGTSDRDDIGRFIMRYYRRSGSGVTYIELTHR